MRFSDVSERRIRAALASWRLWGVEGEPVLLHPLSNNESRQAWLVGCGPERYVLLIGKTNAQVCETQGLLEAGSPGLDVIYRGADFSVAKYLDVLHAG